MSFAAKTFVAGGVVGLTLTLAGFEGWPAFTALMAGALTPALYSLIAYKQLEKR